MATPSSHSPYPRRVAMLSLHTSPLATPGVGDAGGLNVYVRELAQRLGERGLDVDVFTRRDNPDEAPVTVINEHARVHQVVAGPVAPVAKEELPGLVPAFAAAVTEFTRASGREHDLIHTHYWLSGMAGLQLAADHELPLVHTMHTMARVKNASRGSAQVGEPDVRERGETEIVAGATVLTANTTDEARELEQHYAARPGQIMIVPPGVDLHTFHPCDQPQSRAQLGMADDEDVILFVGRVQPLKAPDVLIKALAIMVQHRPDRRSRVRLVIIGSPSGPEAAWAQTLPRLAAELGVADLVTFGPHAARAELFRWYCAADVVAVPSHTESFGLVALEAQACGRPVVATDVGGLRHAVEDGKTGLLVPSHDPASWARALTDLLDDADVRDWLGVNGAAHAATFSWDNTAAATLGAYRYARAVSGSPRPR